MDREKLVAELQEDFDLLMDDTEPTAEEIKIANDISVALALLKEQEAEWLEVDDKHDAFDCSNCGAMAGRKCLYCPGCGAKMKNGTRAMEGR